MLHPGAVTRNAFGDPNYYNLCPSNPDARAYVCALVEDLTHSYKPDLVELSRCWQRETLRAWVPCSRAKIGRKWFNDPPRRREIAA
jgi:hypothetical protein